MAKTLAQQAIRTTYRRLARGETTPIDATARMKAIRNSQADALYRAALDVAERACGKS